MSKGYKCFNLTLASFYIKFSIASHFRISYANDTKFISHRGCRYGGRRYIGNIFILYSFLFCRQNMALLPDLTLLNTSLSKKSTFAWFSCSKVCIINNYSYLCSTRTRQASQRCSNVRVVFAFIIRACRSTWLWCACCHRSYLNQNDKYSS